MDKKKFKLGLGIGIISILLISIVLILKSIDSPTDIKLNITDLEDKKVDIKSFNTKPLVVNFWATWCAPCIKEFKIFEKVNDNYNQKVSFLMLSDESTKSIKKFKEANNYTFLYMKSISKFSDYGINSRPATYFYNKKGELVDKIIGSITEQQLTESIQKITE